MGKAIVLAIGAYVMTLIVAALIALFLMSVMAPRGCSDLSQALLMLWGAIAVLFLASGVAVGVGAGKFALGPVGWISLVAGYAVTLMVSYVVIAFGLMVAFNC